MTFEWRNDRKKNIRNVTILENGKKTLFNGKENETKHLQLHV